MNDFKMFELYYEKIILPGVRNAKASEEISAQASIYMILTKIKANVDSIQSMPKEIIDRISDSIAILEPLLLWVEEFTSDFICIWDIEILVVSSWVFIYKWETIEDFYPLTENHQQIFARFRKHKGKISVTSEKKSALERDCDSLNDIFKGSGFRFSLDDSFFALTWEVNEEHSILENS